jgi:nucleoside 2-deoxyribosyltransferase
MRIYMAGPIFFEADRLRNELWRKMLQEEFPNAYIYDPLANTDINGV